MSANNYIKTSLFAGIVFFMTFCGQRGVPTGGPKDMESPKVVNSTPKNFSTNFKGKKIVLKFDEFIQVKGFNNEFIISPPLKKNPSYELSGKKLTIEFDSTLAENTTYSMYFGKSIIDLNEGNVLDSNSFVFSTGNQLDSLELKGTIVDASSGAPISGVFVQLYKNKSDTAPIKTFPSYFATAKDGKFKFTNLASGTYKIFALEDANKNFLYDLPNEKIAFLKQEILVPEDSLPLNLKLFSPEKTKQKVFKPSAPFSGKITIPFNKMVQDIVIQYINFKPNKDSITEVWNKAKDTLSIYSTQFINLDSLKLRLIVDLELDDTLTVYFKKKKLVFGTQISYSSSFPNDYHDHLVFKYSIPLLNSTVNNVKIILDKDTLIPNALELDANKLSGKLIFNFKPEKTYQIVFYPGAFQSVFKQNNDTLKFVFKMAKPDDFGNLLINYNLPNTNYVVQLMNKDVVVKEFFPKTAIGKIEYNALKPGEYQLKFILDDNKDGRWTTGDYILGRQPESSILYNKTILVRANWDLEIAAP